MSDPKKILNPSISKVEKSDLNQTNKVLGENLVNAGVSSTSKQSSDVNYFDYPFTEKKTQESVPSEKAGINVNEKIKGGARSVSEIFDFNEAKAMLTRFGNTLRVSTFSRQIGFGTGTGILTGFLTIKLGRLSALAIGSGILLYEVAHYNKIVLKDLETVSKQINQKKISDNVNVRKTLELFKKFAGKNKIFSVGFIGGFLLGTGINQ